jgi:hypothetical protein
MMLIILAVVIALVAWALHLMQEAISRQEFSLMLAGTLVASASAALMGVYFLMGNYMGFVNHSSASPEAIEQAYDSIRWYVESQMMEENPIYLSDSSASFAPIIGK